MMLDWKKVAINMVAALLVIGLYVSYRHYFPRDPYNSPLFAIVQGQMPLCDSAPIRHLLHKTVDESPMAVQNGLKIIKLGGFNNLPTEAGRLNPALATDPNETVRFCGAMIYTNAGQNYLQFELSWIDDSKNTVWLQVLTSNFF